MRTMRSSVAIAYAQFRLDGVFFLTRSTIPTAPVEWGISRNQLKLDPQLPC
ncbi:MAG: hypothetical protein KME22_19965 [Hassallia sp. WJT32-NPBG1]|nr:hypothetical protein [Hassallia sp. WJT32-NPBG1]